MRLSSSVEDTKSLELKKHVGLIHSTNKLTLLERKISNALLYNAYDNLLTSDEHQIHIPSLCDLIGYNSNDYKLIKRSLISLISTVLEWNLIDKEKSGKEHVWMASSMLSDAKIDGPICTYSYSKRMKELCYYPEFYGRLNIKILSQFKSTYGLALYENCIRYQRIPQTPWFDLLTYRKLMGVENGKYESFCDLNKRVIKPSVAEVNNHASINVAPEFKKQGRVVTAIRFLIDKQPDSEVLASIENVDKENTLLGRLMDDYGCSTKQTEHLMSMYSEECLLDKITLIESSKTYRDGKITHLLKYLEKALKEDFQPPKSSKDNIERLQIKRKQETSVRKEREEKMHEYRNYLNTMLPETVANLCDKQKLTIEKGFEKYIRSTVYQGIYANEGLDNVLIKDRFGNYVREEYPELLASIISFEDFCNGCVA